MSDEEVAALRKELDGIKVREGGEGGGGCATAGL